MNANLKEQPIKPTFKSLSTSTAEDWDNICEQHRQYFAGLPDRILAHLRLLDNDYGGFPIDRLQHSLQTAELAAEDGRDEEYIVCALLHDIGDTLGTANHPDVAAAILYPFVSEANHWMIKHHGVFQGYNFFHHIGLDRNMRDELRDSEYFDYAAEFIAKYDDPAFDADKPRLELDMFEPMVRNVFAEAKHSVYKALQQ
ncbi:MAG: HD domain-containing protein [Gammaproteobacteria bacterium]